MPVCFFPICLNYAVKYGRSEYRVPRKGIAGEESRQLFPFVRTRTDPGDVIVFRKPGILALLTGRKALFRYPGEYREDLLAYLRSVNAASIIEGPYGHGEVRRYRLEHREHFRSVFGNGDFQVFRIEYP